MLQKRYLVINCGHWRSSKHSFYMLKEYKPGCGSWKRTHDVEMITKLIMEGRQSGRD